MKSYENILIFSLTFHQNNPIPCVSLTISKAVFFPEMESNSLCFPDFSDSVRTLGQICRKCRGL